MKIEKLVKCARCGGTHHDLVFAKFDQPIEAARYDTGFGDSVDVIFTHWAPCPNNGQPIVLRVDEDLPKSMNRIAE